VKKRLNTIIVSAAIAIYLLSGLSLSCQTAKAIINQNMAEVKKGSITANVNIRGKLEMPREIKLRFNTSGTIQKIYVSNGNKVKAGTLLAKLDDTAQVFNVAQSQYNVELALNALVEKVHGSVLGIPNFYPPTTVALGVEQAQEEINTAKDYMSKNDYKNAVFELRIAVHDLQASYYLMQPPSSLINDQDYPGIFQTINLLDADIRLISESHIEPLGVQGLIERGQYSQAMNMMEAVISTTAEAKRMVDEVAGMIKSYAPPYPDTSTSLDILRQAKESMDNVRVLLQQGNYDAGQVAELLRLAQHDMDLSDQILNKSQMLFKQGLNLTTLRNNNINLEKAQTALDSAKSELMKTEILAPFDGIVVDVPQKENDILSTVDYSTKTIVELVDTTSLEFDGTVDEVDMSKILDKTSASISVDIMQGSKFSGKVIFISPYGNLSTGTATYNVQIKLDPVSTSLQRGLSATASIFIGKHDNTLLAPASAVRNVSGSLVVDIVKDDVSGQIERRAVTTGLANDDFVEILSGVKEGEKILIQNLRKQG
jgi:RND family efflux transporter MFP subunit